MSAAATRSPKLPPACFVHTFWRLHRVLYRLSGGRFLWTPASKRGWGALHLTTIGRRSGRERSVIVGYIEDGPNLVTLAMNGWDEGNPAWWLNLEAHPDATVRLSRRHPGPVRAHAAEGQEHARLWQRWLSVPRSCEHWACCRSRSSALAVRTRGRPVWSSLTNAGDGMPGSVGRVEEPQCRAVRCPAPAQGGLR